MMVPLVYATVGVNSTSNSHFLHFSFGLVEIVWREKEEMADGGSRTAIGHFFLLSPKLYPKLADPVSTRLLLAAQGTCELTPMAACET
jgi:hypothetical protein